MQESNSDLKALFFVESGKVLGKTVVSVQFLDQEQLLGAIEELCNLADDRTLELITTYYGGTNRD